MKKKLFKISFALVLLATFTLSCEDEIKNPLTQKTRLILESQQFRNLNLDPQDLVTDHEPIEATSKYGKGWILNFRTESFKSLIAIVDENDLIIEVFVFEINSLQNKESFSNLLLTGKFSGQFILTGRNVMTFDLKNSKLTGFKNEQIEASYGRTKCSMRDAYQCAAATIDNMGPFSYTFCLLEIPLCLGVALADCAISGCPPGGL